MTADRKTPYELAEAHIGPNHDDWSATHYAEVRAMIAEAIEADRKDRAAHADDVAHAVTYENYGPDGDTIVWRTAEAEAVFSDEAHAIQGKYLLDAALNTGHLDGDGIMALLREAARR